MKSNHTNRNGYTLVEILAILPAVAVVLGTVAMTIHVMYQSDHQIRDAVNDQRQLERFATRLRIDTHQAVSATVQNPSGSDTEPAELRLALPDGSLIQYRSYSNHIDRRVLREGVLEHRETYRVLPVGKSVWTIDRDREFPLVSIELTHPMKVVTNEHVAPATFRLNAALRIVQHEPISSTR